jgi:predicted RNA binding protein YcfA (HicA-like mRNA interferase family)
MAKEDITVRMPNPHQRDIGRELLARILRQAGISREDWEKL